MATKPKSKTKKTVSSKKTNEAPRYHMPNSPKSKVHATFDSKGKKAAAALAEKLEVTPGRANRWFREWGAAA
jgi:hypothetical protein